MFQRYTFLKNVTHTTSTSTPGFSSTSNVYSPRRFSVGSSVTVQSSSGSYRFMRNTIWFVDLICATVRSVPTIDSSSLTCTFNQLPTYTLCPSNQTPWFEQKSWANNTQNGLFSEKIWPLYNLASRSLNIAVRGRLVVVDLATIGKRCRRCDTTSGKVNELHAAYKDCFWSTKRISSALWFDNWPPNFFDRLCAI